MAGVRGMDPKVLEKLTNELFVHISQKDYPAVQSMLAQECQVVNEISRCWLRGAGEIEEYFGMVGAGITDLSSSLRDVTVAERGDVGIVTCMLDRSYRYDGRNVAVVSPTTVLFVKEDGDWKVALVHAVPLPECH